MPGCGPRPPGDAGEAGSGTQPSATRTAADPDAIVDPFVDVALESGLEFVHCNGMTGRHYFVEQGGAGGALVDLDGDGDLDIYLVQGGPLSPSTGEAEEGCDHDRVFRNDLRVEEDGTRHLSFTDVTAESGLLATGYGMGVASGDFDNDGRVDLYVTQFGANQLWRNVSRDGAIAFEDVTSSAGGDSGLDETRWSTSASFFDADADGWLDLYVANYVDFTIAGHRPCRSPGGRPDYCGPQSYSGETDRLLHNRGDGTFEDVTGPAGLLNSSSSGLGVVVADFDLDGRPDVYVANDLRRNFQWHNLGVVDGSPRFENVALESGSAVSMQGVAQASMGVVAGDLDEDGDEDLFMTHLSADTNTLYANNGKGQFDDRSAASGLGAPSLAATGFGTALLDFDLDGWLDLVAVNGAVKVIEAQVLAGEPYPLKQPNQLFRNRGDGRFVEIPAGADLGRMEVSRGVAIGDIDNDGKTDLLVVNNLGPVRLLVNRSREAGAWIGLRLVNRLGRDALGTRVAVVRDDGHTSWRRVATDGSYLSASDPRVIVGLGTSRVREVRVYWLGSEEPEIWTDLETGTYHTLAEGRGRTGDPS